MKFVPTKTCQLQIRVTPEQKRHIEQQARKSKQTVSEWVLQSSLSKSSAEFEDLTTQLRSRKWARHALAALHDYLMAIDSQELKNLPFPQKIPNFYLNYLAALIETAAYQKNTPPPSWVQTVEPLEEPYFASKLITLRIYLLVHSPPAFKKRNIFVDMGLGDRV